MAKIERNILIKAPLDKVFSYVTYPKNELEWLPSMTEVRDIMNLGVGMHWGWTYKMLGMSLKGKTEVDLPPENDTSFMIDWNYTKGGPNGQEVLHAGEVNQDDLVTIAESFTGIVPVISMFSPSSQTLMPSISKT